MNNKFYKRSFCCKLHRLTENSSKVIWTRYFNSLAKCISRGTELSILTGQPGDVLEITSSNFGYLVATIKLKVGATSISDLNIKFYLKKEEYASERSSGQF